MWKKYLYSHVYSSSIHNDQYMESNLSAINRWMDINNVVCVYHGILFAHKNKKNLSCDNMDETWGHYVYRSFSVTITKILEAWHFIKKKILDSVISKSTVPAPARVPWSASNHGRWQKQGSIMRQRGMHGEAGSWRAIQGSCLVFITMCSWGLIGISWELSHFLLITVTPMS